MNLARINSAADSEKRPQALGNGACLVWSLRRPLGVRRGIYPRWNLARINSAADSEKRPQALGNGACLVAEATSRCETRDLSPLEFGPNQFGC